MMFSYIEESMKDTTVRKSTKGIKLCINLVYITGNLGLGHGLFRPSAAPEKWCDDLNEDLAVSIVVLLDRKKVDLHMRGWSERCCRAARRHSSISSGYQDSIQIFFDEPSETSSELSLGSLIYHTIR